MAQLFSLGCLLFFMRYLASVMLFGGFVWICICQFEAMRIPRDVRLEQFSKITRQETYKYEDVNEAIQNTVAAMSIRYPFFCIGGCFMLLGALILDRTQRPK